MQEGKEDAAGSHVMTNGPTEQTTKKKKSCGRSLLSTVYSHNIQLINEDFTLRELVLPRTY